MANHLTVLEPCLALNAKSMNRLMPFLTGVASFFFYVKFNKHASLKFPFFLISLVVTPKRDQQQSHESESFFDGRLSDCPAE